MTESAMPESVPVTVTSPAAEDAGRLVTASRSRLIIIAVLLVLFTEIVPLQIQMVSLILPKIGLSFPTAGASVGWSITIVTVAGAATMGLVGKAADVLGKKRVLLVMGLLAAIGTLLCAVTSSWALFLVGRGLTGVSLGIAVVNYSLVRDLFPRRWIPVAVGFIGTGLAFSSIIGPLVTGAFAGGSWRPVLWFLFAFTIVTTVLVALGVPDSPLRARQRLDIPGAVLLGVGVGGVLIYLSEGSTWGWGSAAGLGWLIGGLVALAAYAAWEVRTATPMLDLPILRSPRVLLVMIIQLFLVGTQTLPAFMVSYLFETPPQHQLEQQVLAGLAAKQHVPASAVAPFVHFHGTVSGAGYSVFGVAWHVSIPLAVFIVLGAPIGGWIARRTGARLPLIIGAAAMAGGCALWTGWHSTWPEQAAIGVLFGLGVGFDFAAWPNLIMDVVPADKQGVSGGMVQVFGGIGGSAAAALVTAVLAAHPFTMVITPPGGHAITAAVPQVFTNSGFSQAYLLIGVVPCVIALALALMLRSGRSPARGGAPEQA